MKKPVATIETIWQYIDQSKPVDVYRNLQTGLWSIRQGGIVRCHIDQIWLSRVSYRVSEAGRQRVIKDRRKNVHAYMRGTVMTPEAIETFQVLIDDHTQRFASPSWDITYNPYKYSHFQYCNAVTECRPISQSGFASLRASRVPRVVAYGVAQ